MPRSLVWFVLVALLAAGGTPCLAAQAADEPAIIPAAEAKSHVSQRVVVEMRVRAGRLLADKGICFLNSEDDFRDDKNFSAVIGRKGLEELRAIGVDNPALEYVGKRLRVQGVIALYQDRPQIIVEHPRQLVVVPDDQ